MCSKILKSSRFIALVFLLVAPAAAEYKPPQPISLEEALERVGKGQTVYPGEYHDFRLHKKESVPVLLKAIEDKRYHPQLQAKNLLKEVLGYKFEGGRSPLEQKALKRLLQLIRSEDHQMVMTALEVLSVYRGVDEATDAIKDIILNGKEPSIRSGAIWYLQLNLGTEGMVLERRFFERLAEDPEYLVALKAAETLKGHFADDGRYNEIVEEQKKRYATVESSLRTLEEGNYWEIDYASQALIKFGGEALPGLFHILATTDNDKVSQSAYVACSRLLTNAKWRKDEYLQSLLTEYRSAGLKKRRRLLKLIGVFRLSKPAQEVILESLPQEKDQNARLVIINLISWDHGQREIDLLRGLLRDEIAEIRMAAAYVLAGKGDRSGYRVAAQVLKAMKGKDIKDPKNRDWRAVMEAARVMGKIGGEKDIGLLRPYADSKVNQFAYRYVMDAISEIELRGQPDSESEIVYLKSHFEKLGHSGMLGRLKKRLSGPEYATYLLGVVRKRAVDDHILKMAEEALVSSGWVNMQECYRKPAECKVLSPSEREALKGTNPYGIYRDER